MKTDYSACINKYRLSSLLCCLIFLVALLSACTSTGKEGRTRAFDADWRFLKDSVSGAEMATFDDSQWRELDLPHDWSIEDLPAGDTSVTGITVGPFSGKSPGGMATGHVLGGTGWYRKHFILNTKDAGKSVTIQFDGVYMDCDVWLNEQHLGNHPYGYTTFTFNLTPYLKPAGAENVLAVRVRNLGKNSRWYSGSGIYRHVWLTVTDPLHIAQWGVYITTPEVTKDSAWVNILTILNNSTNKKAGVTVKTTINDPEGRQVKTIETPVQIEANAEGDACQFVTINLPKLWSTGTPNLYTADVQVLNNGKVIDRVTNTFGLRSIKFSAANGLSINGEKILLKGGCMHHDNGPLGSAAIDRAEERRVELMKSFGFNAIRTSHNPPSPAFLDACDRLGMLVIDEAFDCWEVGKNPDDYHRFFDAWWQRDIQVMVQRDRNHPSIILWSIGNEIPERGDTSGVRIGQQLIDEVHRIDSYRRVTAAICEFWDHPGRTWEETSPAFSILEIGGYNYQFQHYVSDHAGFPNRVMVGTESVPQDAFENWQQVEQHPWVIGDFVWTGMDYLGESGIGNALLDNQKLDWPWFNANCGDIDICGFKKPQSYFRDVVWYRSKICMAVHTPLPEGRTEKISYWGWPDEVQCWNWPGQEGKKLQVSVYSRCSSVRLELNGKEISTKPVSAETRLRAFFDVPYAPGRLCAIGLDNGKAVDSVILNTTGPAKLIRLTPDRITIQASRNDLAYVTVEVTDEAGNIVPDANIPVLFSISGMGELAAVGNANPKEMASFSQPRINTYHGKSLVILRPRGKAGLIKLEAQADGLEPATILVRTR